jgi:hypothetical protein
MKEIYKLTAIVTGIFLAIAFWIIVIIKYY